jgi:hypothetical protein
MLRLHQGKDEKLPSVFRSCVSHPFDEPALRDWKDVIQCRPDCRRIADYGLKSNSRDVFLLIKECVLPDSGFDTPRGN